MKLSIQNFKCKNIIYSKDAKMVWKDIHQLYINGYSGQEGRRRPNAYMRAHSLSVSYKIAEVNVGKY